MALKHDNQGFLIGDPVDLSTAVNQLKQMRKDISDIKRAVSGVAAKDSNNSNPGGSSVATPNRPRSSQNSPGNILLPISYGDAVTPNGRGRDASGRFIRNAANQSPSEPANDDEEEKKKKKEKEQAGLLSRFTDKVSTAVKESTNGVEEADPTIKAFKEVAEPMRRGYEIFTGGGDKKEAWYRKIFGELKLFRKEESVFNRAANRSLHNIEGNPDSGGGEGGKSFLGGLLGSISPWVMAAITGIGSALLAGVTTALGVIFSPIGLAIGAAAAVAWGLFTEEGQKFFGEVGAKVIAGWDAVVTAFAPVSESIQKGWDTVKGGFDSLINGMVSSWDAFTGFLKDKFGIDIPAIFKPVVDVSKKVVEAAKETVKDGIDVAKETAGKAVDAVAKSSPKTTEALGNAWDKVKEGAGKIASHATGKTAANKAAMINEMAAQGITDPKEQAMLMAQVDHESGGFAFTKELGRDSYFDKYDAGTKKGKELGNTEKGDGAKYKGRGLIQLTGKANYAAAGKDLGLDLINHPELAETPENAAKTAMWFWKKNKLGESAKKGDVKTNRHIINGGEKGLDDVENKLGKYLVAANNGEFNVGATEPKPAAEQKPAVASIADDPTQGGRYKYETLEGGKVQVTDNQTGVMELASDEQADAYRKQQGKPYLDSFVAANNPDSYRAGGVFSKSPSLNDFAAGPVNATQVASIAAPKPPTFAPPPPIPEAPPIIQPLGSDSNRNLTVTMPTPDVGQDVRDRGIAHIATGGLSGRG